MATVVQPYRLYYKPGCLTAVKALVDHGYVQADSVPTKATRSPYYYMLTTQGMRYLEDIGYAPHKPVWGREATKYGLFIEHSLDISDILIAASLLSRTYTQYYPTISCMSVH